MNYLDVYHSRINFMGESTAQRIRNGGIRSFYKWLAQSPHTVRNLSVERGIYFDAIILTNKDKEATKIMLLNVSNDTFLLIGDIINWELDNGTIEKWIIIQEQKKVNGTYRTFWIVRCNYLMKWIDSNGHIQQSWSYFVSSLDSKIKGNFRTWNSLISPQPNKYAELLMPRYPIDRATNFIVEEESWTVVEYDHTSVPGVIYLSLTEGKINSIYDDVENNLADTDRLAHYDLSIPDETQIFHIGDIIDQGSLKYTLTKNGIPFTQQPVQLTSSNKQIVKLIDGQLTAVGNGVVDIIITLQNYPTIHQKLTINVGEEEKEFAAYIEGPDTIRLDREIIYTLKANDNINGTVNFSLGEVAQETKNEITQVVSIIDITKLRPKQRIIYQEKYPNINLNVDCIIKANNKNVLDTVYLNAEYNGNIYQKKIKVIPLW